MSKIWPTGEILNSTQLTIIINVCERHFYGIFKVKYFMNHPSYTIFHIQYIDCRLFLSMFPFSMCMKQYLLRFMYTEFNFCSCPERKTRKTEILNYCRCQSPLWTLIRLISTFNWIYFHFIHLFMGHETLLLLIVFLPFWTLRKNIENVEWMDHRFEYTNIVNI